MIGTYMLIVSNYIYFCSAFPMFEWGRGVGGQRPRRERREEKGRRERERLSLNCERLEI